MAGQRLGGGVAATTVATAVVAIVGGTARSPCLWTSLYRPSSSKQTPDNVIVNTTAAAEASMPVPDAGARLEGGVAAVFVGRGGARQWRQ